MPYYDTVTSVLEKKIIAPSGAWIELRYGSTNAPGRKYIGVFNRSPYRIYITTSNSDVAAADITANPAHCRCIRQGGERIFPYSDHVTLYAQSVTGGATLVITEEVG